MAPNWSKVALQSYPSCISKHQVGPGCEHQCYYYLFWLHTDFLGTLLYHPPPGHHTKNIFRIAFSCSGNQSCLNSEGAQGHSLTLPAAVRNLTGRSKQCARHYDTDLHAEGNRPHQHSQARPYSFFGFRSIVFHEHNTNALPVQT